MKSFSLRTFAVAIASFALALGIAPGFGPVTASAAVDPSGGCAPGTTSRTCTFIKTGALEQWVVPAGVNAVTIEAWGGHGGVSPYGGPEARPGGAGAHVSATLAVTPGSTLDVTVAGDGYECGPADGCGGYGGGGSASYGGGGGGASRLQVSGGSLLLVAGGGGGSGESQPCEANWSLAGGAGGNAGGLGGTGDSCTYAALTVNGSSGGQPGTNLTGGAGGAAGTATGSDPCYMFNADSAGAAGSLGLGANGYEGGSGGGGYYGGGAGGDASEAFMLPEPPCDSLFPMVGAGAGGGGGGSNYMDPSATNTTTGLSDRAVGSDGLVEITYAAATQLTIKAPGKVEQGTRAKITGALISGGPGCVGGQTVNLMQGTKQLNWNLTSATGAYKFNLKVMKKTKVYVTYAGTTDCSPSTSASKTIKVT